MSEELISGIGNFVTSEKGASLIGGLAKSAGSIITSDKEANRENAFYKAQQDLAAKYAKTTTGDDVAGIMAFKRPMTEQMKRAIVQDVTSQIAARGGSGNTALVQEAIAAAMAKAEDALFQEAANNYYHSRELPIQAQARNAPPRPTQVSNPFDALAKYFATKPTATTDTASLPALPQSTNNVSLFTGAIPSVPGGAGDDTTKTGG